MFRPVFSPAPIRQRRLQESLGRLLAPLTLWICVSVSLRYGYYGDRRMVLGPSSSRLMKASSVFVEQVEVRDEDKKGVLLYGFSEKPELSLETNWSRWEYIIVASYSRKGFSLWLNRGSRIRMRWETQTSILNQLEVVLVKGERKYETLLPKVTTTLNVFNLSQSLRGNPLVSYLSERLHYVKTITYFSGKEVEYTIEEDDKYYLGLVNTNRKSIIMKLSLNVTSKLYDISKAMNMCSTTKGSCRLKLLFPNIHYVVVTTPDNDDTGGSYVELSFVARVITYIAILGFIIVIIFLVLRYLGACDSENTLVETTSSYQVSESETEPILPQKSVPFTYGTNVEEDEEDRSSSSSSEDLYDAKLCVICYDEQRNCFFIPCGHCATCYDCAQRIMEGENKMCPICRRLIHKVRRLFTP